jgi:hypothetical protein
VPEAALPLRVPTASFTRAAARVPADGGGAPSLGLSAAASACVFQDQGIELLASILEAA